MKQIAVNLFLRRESTRCYFLREQILHLIKANKAEKGIFISMLTREYLRDLYFEKTVVSYGFTCARGWVLFMHFVELPATKRSIRHKLLGALGN